MSYKETFFGTILLIFVAVLMTWAGHKDGEKQGYKEGVKDCLNGKVHVVIQSDTLITRP